MLRISRLADYSILIMTVLAKSPNARMNAQLLSKKTDLNLPTVSKLLKLLLDANLVGSHRGPSGGYAIAQDIAKISLADMIAAIDGPISMTECALINHDCSHASSCDAKENWQIVNRVIEAALKSVSLESMCQSLKNHPLAMKGLPITHQQLTEVSS